MAGERIKGGGQKGNSPEDKGGGVRGGMKRNFIFFSDCENLEARALVAAAAVVLLLNLSYGILKI